MLIFSISAMAQEFGGETDGLNLECLLEPHMSVKIGTPVPGALSGVFVDRGDMVKKGQRVAQIDSRQQVAAVDLSRERAAYAKRRVERNKELVEQDLMSTQDSDDMETDAQLAALELVEQETRVEIRNIRSPVTGVVVERFKGPQEYVQETDILEIAQIDPLNVEVVVPVRYFGRIEMGSTAMVALEEPVGGTYEAKVTVIDRVIDAASGTFGVRLEIPNKKHKIPAGLRCNVSFPTDG
jgi:RND family efflux transporter MFP subunit